FWSPLRRDRWERRFLPAETVGTRSDPHDAAGNALANLPWSRSRAAAARATAGAGSSSSLQGLSKCSSCHSNLVLQAFSAARRPKKKRLRISVSERLQAFVPAEKFHIDACERQLVIKSQRALQRFF